MTGRERMVIAGGALALALMAAYQFWPSGGSGTATASAESVSITEHRLDTMRNIAASAQAKADVLKQVQAELAEREKGLIRADSAQQAQAQTITILRELLNTEGIEIASTQLGAVQPLGDAYGLVQVGVQMECRMEQLLNIMASLSARPELLAVRDVQITTANSERKTVRANLTVGGVIPKDLLPAKDTKGGSRL